jgi:hypothetical protein
MAHVPHCKNLLHGNEPAGKRCKVPAVLTAVLLYTLSNICCLFIVCCLLYVRCCQHTH